MGRSLCFLTVGLEAVTAAARTEAREPQSRGARGRCWGSGAQCQTWEVEVRPSWAGRVEGAGV